MRTRKLLHFHIVSLLAGVLLVLGIWRVGTAPRSAPDAETLWRGLAVVPERRCAPYDAEDYPYPQAVEDQIIDTLALGGVYGPYTGRWFDSKTETDIEHIVARSEAHDSGLCAADDATRRGFATDLLNLTLAAPAVNRNQKRDLDAAEWLPDVNRCWFAARVIAVRQEYRLTIDRREADALDQVLAGCASTELLTFPPRRVPRAGGARRRHFGCPHGVGRQRERPHHVRGSASARDRPSDARSSGISVHARRRRRRGRL